MVLGISGNPPTRSGLIPSPLDKLGIISLSTPSMEVNTPTGS
jgi:hypothetical protein